MEQALIAELIQAAQSNPSEEITVLITPKGDDKYSYVGTIDPDSSSNTQLALQAIDLGQRPARSEGPTYRFPRECIRHVAYAGQVRGEASFWFIIDGNHSLTGVRITSDEFFRLNDRQNGGGWPTNFTHDDPEVYVYLKAVEFEYGIVSRDTTISLDEINCCGERW
ncbi:hypothetical protein BH23CHL2_BH23CHL2_18640 [soil metagenome]